MINYNDGSWYGWNGGECPVHPETVVDCADERGIKFYRKAKEFNWSNSEFRYCVIAFRVVKEHRETREFWVRAGIAFVEHVPNSIHVREVVDND